MLLFTFLFYQLIIKITICLYSVFLFAFCHISSIIKVINSLREIFVKNKRLFLCFLPLLVLLSLINILYASAIYKIDAEVSPGEWEDSAYDVLINSETKDCAVSFADIRFNIDSDNKTLFFFFQYQQSLLYNSGHGVWLKLYANDVVFEWFIDIRTQDSVIHPGTVLTATGRNVSMGYALDSYIEAQIQLSKKLDFKSAYLEIKIRDAYHRFSKTKTVDFHSLITPQSPNTISEKNKEDKVPSVTTTKTAVTNGTANSSNVKNKTNNTTSPTDKEVIAQRKLWETQNNTPNLKAEKEIQAKYNNENTETQDKKISDEQSTTSQNKILPVGLALLLILLGVFLILLSLRKKQPADKKTQ